MSLCSTHPKLYRELGGQKQICRLMTWELWTQCTSCLDYEFAYLLPPL